MTATETTCKICGGEMAKPNKFGMHAGCARNNGEWDKQRGNKNAKTDNTDVPAFVQELRENRKSRPQRQRMQKNMNVLIDQDKIAQELEHYLRKLTNLDTNAMFKQGRPAAKDMLAEAQEWLNWYGINADIKQTGHWKYIINELKKLDN